MIKTEATMIDTEKVRAEFPILSQSIHGHPLVYLDSAASAQQPRAVLDAVAHYETTSHANVHRSVHTLGARATQAYEHARSVARSFLGAKDAEVVFTKGCTEALNLVAHGLAEGWLREGDEILLTELEHHSNIVPWQMAAARSGAVVRVVPIDERGDLDLSAFDRLLGERTRVLALGHVSNALGTVNPVSAMAARAKQAGAVVVVDGAQGAPHLKVNFAELGVDFYTISGHKMYGPTGIGALVGTREWLDRLPAYQGGGDMIHSVSFAKTTYAKPPAKFEAGTPNISGAVGLAAAMEFIEGLGYDALRASEDALVRDAVEALADLDGVTVLGAPKERCGVVSFLVEGVHPHDVGTVLDTEGVAVRAGHHCAQPLMERLGVAATVRASFGAYNGPDDVDRLVEALGKVRRLFG
ncbi:MAG: cysteine desulfurase [Fimbriimonadaceae bacterium]|nr:cysteine desulfurase [Fimbriimonadaceae bacterium]